MDDAWNYEIFKTNFLKYTGLDLHLYKDKQMERRIRQWIRREKRSGFRDFFDYLIGSTSARDSFLNYLTINTSEFFRDEKIYNKLEKEVFPELLRNFPGRLVIWSAGCSIGAEPYTIAIVLDRLNALSRAVIHATDMDEQALLTARRACYQRNQLGKTAPEVVEKYFSREDDTFCVNPNIQKTVAFQRHNLLTGKAIPGCHIIFCRNVFIYFKPEAQHLLLERFSRSLHPGGFLVLGAAEYISNPASFSLNKRFNTIFQKLS